MLKVLAWLARLAVCVLLLVVGLLLTLASSARAEEGNADPWHSHRDVAAYTVQEGIAKDLTATQSVPPDHAKYDQLSGEDKEIVDCVAVAAARKNDEALKGLPCFTKIQKVFTDPAAKDRQKLLATSMTYRWPCIPEVQTKFGETFAGVSADESRKRCEDAKEAVSKSNTANGRDGSKMEGPAEGQGFWDKLAHPKEQAARAVAGDAVGDVVANPNNAATRTSDKLKQGATSMMNVALDTVIHGTKIDFSQKWFTTSYSYSAGLGMMLLVGGLAFSLTRYSHCDDPSESVQDILTWAAFAMIGMVFGPLFMWIWAGLTGALEDGILTLLRTDKSGWKSSLMHPLSAMSTTGNGEVWGIVMCILAILAGLSIWVSYLLQTVVAYVGGVLGGAGAGALSHRQLRPNAIRILLMIFSLLLMRPIFLLVLLSCSMMSAHFNEMTTLKQTSSDGFVALGLSLTVMVVVALAPFKLLRFSPVQLDGGAAAGVGEGHGAGAAAGSLAMGLAGAGIGAMVSGGATGIRKLASRPAVRGSSRDTSTPHTHQPSPTDTTSDVSASGPDHTTPPQPSTHTSTPSDATADATPPARGAGAGGSSPRARINGSSSGGPSSGETTDGGTRDGGHDGETRNGGDPSSGTGGEQDGPMWPQQPASAPHPRISPTTSTGTTGTGTTGTGTTSTGTTSTGGSGAGPGGGGPQETSVQPSRSSAVSGALSSPFGIRDGWSAGSHMGQRIGDQLSYDVQAIEPDAEG